jgi:hypothetical protein
MRIKTHVVRLTPLVRLAGERVGHDELGVARIDAQRGQVEMYGRLSHLVRVEIDHDQHRVGGCVTARIRDPFGEADHVGPVDVMEPQVS